MAGLKITVLTLVFVCASVVSLPAAASTNCGDTIAKVMDIVKQKFPNQDHAWLRNFLGNWLSDGERIRLTMNESFKVKGYPVMFCPSNGNLFQVRYKDGGSLAGVARMLGRNRIEISRTAIGTIYLEREGSISARN